MSPCIITGEQKRPDIVVIDKQRSWVFVLELTVGFETRIKENAVRKHNHYSGLCSELRNQYNSKVCQHLGWSFGNSGKEQSFIHGLYI
jgi:hypothetical protein